MSRTLKRFKRGRRPSLTKVDYFCFEPPLHLLIGHFSHYNRCLLVFLCIRHNFLLSMPLRNPASYIYLEKKLILLVVSRVMRRSILNKKLYTFTISQLIYGRINPLEYRRVIDNVVLVQYMNNIQAPSYCSRTSKEEGAGLSKFERERERERECILKCFILSTTFLNIGGGLFFQFQPNFELEVLLERT